MKYKMLNTVKERRLFLNMSQQQLADLVGCSRNSIGSIERYEFMPTAYTAGLLCSALMCSFEDLFIFVSVDDS